MATTLFSTIVGQAQVVPVLDTAWTTYTGAVTGGGSKTLTALLLKYRQRLNGIEIAFSISGNNVASGGGSTTVSFPVPSGMTIDYTALPTASVGSDLNDEGFGYEYSISTLTAYTPLSAIVPVSATNIGFIRLGASFITSGNLNSTNQPQITGKVWVPIVGMSAYVAQGAGLATANRPGLVYAAEDTTHISNFSGPFAATSATLSISKVNKEIVLMIPGISVNGNNTAAVIAMATPLPAAYRPAFSVRFFAPVRNNAVDQTVPGLVTIDTAGNIAIYLNNTGASFAAGTTATGIYATSLSYAAA